MREGYVPREIRREGDRERRVCGRAHRGIVPLRGRRDVRVADESG